ncbi:MAG: amino acid decarboxylase [Gemmatimonadaceae bacterium]|nr:amino acid decarboxylase [Gemmatimonadaceae bacterium]
MTPEEFRAAGHDLIDWLADYRARVAGGMLPIMARTAPGEIRRALPPSPPDEGEPFEALMRDVDRIVVPGLTLWQHPNFHGYFPANASLASVLGDLLSSGLGVLGLSWQSSPALTEVEEVATDWLRQMVGLSDAWSGVIQDTASTTTMLALICARERATNFSLARGGLQEIEAPLVVYCSAYAHSSVDKAALLAGYGRDHVRHVPCDHAFAMRADALEAAIVADIAAGRTPCAVVATVGTTTSTALDPVAAIVEVARRYGLFVHIDAAMGGSAMILPECRWMWDGIEGADSAVVNVHKWLGVAFDCSIHLVRDRDLLVRVMSTNPSYLRSSVDEQVRNYRDWGIPLGRRFRALKFWFHVREQGVHQLQRRLRRDLDNAQWLAAQVRATPDWSLLAPVPLQTLCVRHAPPGAEGDELDAHTQRWCDAINRSGTAYLTPAILEGRWMVRVSIGSEATEREHVERLWSIMRAAAAESATERARTP